MDCQGTHHKTKVLGISLGAFGAAFLILGSGEISFQQDTFAGNVLILLNASAYALYLVLIKPIMKHYKSTHCNAVGVFVWRNLYHSFHLAAGTESPLV